MEFNHEEAVRQAQIKGRATKQLTCALKKNVNVMKDKARGGTLDVTSKFLDWKKNFVTRYITETVGNEYVKQ